MAKTSLKKYYEEASRRAFLKMMGGGIFGTLPLANLLKFSMMENQAFAAGVPLRLIVLETFTGGKVSGYWRPRGFAATNNPVDVFPLNPSSFTFSAPPPGFVAGDPYHSLQALSGLPQSLVNKINVIDGIDCSLGTTPFSNHNNVSCNIMTGNSPTSVSGEFAEAFRVGGPSIDVFLGSLLGTNIPSYGLGNIISIGYEQLSTMFNANGIHVPFTAPAWDNFNNLFSAYLASNPGGGTPSVDPNLNAKNILNINIKEANALMSGLVGPERDKVNSHFTAMNQLLAQLSAAPPPASTTGDPYQVFPKAGGGRYDLLVRKSASTIVQDPTPIGPTYMPFMNTDANIELMIQALATDVTRFMNCTVGIQEFYAGVQYEPMTPLLKKYAGNNIHDYVDHTVASDEVLAAGTGSSTTIAVAHRDFVRITNFMAQKFVKLIQGLDAIPDGNGTLLDNTLVVWVSDMGNPSSHSPNGVPVVTAGGTARFQTGNYIRKGQGASWPVNKLLLSIVKAFSNAYPQSAGAIDQRLTSLFGSNNLYGGINGPNRTALMGTLPGLVLK